MMAADPWMAFFLTHDPAATARQVKSSAVLILTGANDQQADAKQIPDWMAAFIAAGNPDVTGEILPGLDHLFVVDPDGFPGNYAKLPAPVRVDSRVVSLAPGTVDLADTWRRLGVEVQPGRVTFDEHAPLAALRRAITAPVSAR